MICYWYEVEVVVDIPNMNTTNIRLYLFMSEPYLRLKFISLGEQSRTSIVSRCLFCKLKVKLENSDWDPSSTKSLIANSETLSLPSVVLYAQSAMTMKCTIVEIKYISQ